MDIAKLKKDWLIIISIVFVFNIVLPQSSEDSILNELKKLKDQADDLYPSDNLGAIAKYEELIDTYSNNNLNNKAFFFQVLSDLSYYYSPYNLSIPSKQRKYLSLAKEQLVVEEVSPYALSNYYLDQASVERGKNNFKNMLGYVQQAIDIYNERRDEIKDEIGKAQAIFEEAQTLGWLIMVSEAISDENMLIASYKQFEDFVEKNKNLSDLRFAIVRANFTVGRYYQSRNADIAATYFDKVIAIDVNKNETLYSHICKGLAFINAGKLKKAKKELLALEKFKDLTVLQQLNIEEIAVNYYSKTKNKELLIKHSNNGLTLLNKNKIPITVQDFKQEDFKPIDNLKYPILLSQFAKCLESSSDSVLKKTSAKLYLIGLKQFADNLDHKLSGSQRATFKLIQNRILTNLQNDIYPKEEKIKQLEMMEQIETLIDINDVINNRILASSSSDLDSLFKKESELRSIKTFLNKSNAQNDSIGKKKLFEINLELTQLDEELKQRNGKVYQLTKSSFKFNDLNLNTNSTIIKYAVAQDDLFRIEMKNNGIKIKSLGNHLDIEDKVTAYLKTLKKLGDINELNILASELNQLLLHDISLTEETIIVPDAVLRNLPFELLRSPQGYLLEQTEIYYVNGLAYLKSNLFNKVQHEESVSFFAPSYNNFQLSKEELVVRGSPYNLVGAKEEVNQLSKLTSGIVYDSELATKSQFFNLQPHYTVIHLAGHAYINDKTPELSNLVFSDSSEDNKLYISELYGFRSNADLVVLSACNTGVGGYESGKGIVSLSQAFMYSGIPATVSSLWSAPDLATKEIMVSFYKYLQKGLSKSAALQKSKQDYLRNTDQIEFKHPYYWAPFILNGDNTSLDIKAENNNWMWILIGGVGLILTLIFFKKLKSE
ncbi:CHAT domain-containing protein [Spongiivirga citrea]|uniref:CHAT domain-containing protein n=1 Tax=Spongiivirga citrea TaxID=1481457 RepID=A0A6M0CU96_9FLAO|nr:CHAT domain-containing protein [Spongiivirga citrea]NER19067.1 CHAT domain-containing protein [Spongiivirga citrea]